jgi:ABC-2 type transport system ATP-binding protein
MLELKGLTRRYGDVVALDDVSFTVGEGQMFGFVGPNGAGKTTAMRIVLGVLEPNAGEVLWRGRPMGNEARRQAGYMPEERGLYPKMRVRAQLEYLAQLHGLERSAARRSAERWIDRMGLSERAGDRVETLSLGNQQRVQLAAALVHDPVMLVLDEPFSGLDPVGVDVLAGVLKDKAAAGTPVIFSSHQLELVERLCEAVAIINKGRLVASGTVAALRSAGRRRHWEVGVASADAGWAARLPGARACSTAPTAAYCWSWTTAPTSR